MVDIRKIPTTIPKIGRFWFNGRFRQSMLNSTCLPYKNNTVLGDFTSRLVHVLAFGTPKFYIAPYDKIKHELVNLSSNCDVKSGLSPSINLNSSLGLQTRIRLFDNPIMYRVQMVKIYY